jgi:hypothetical protein
MYTVYSLMKVHGFHSKTWYQGSRLNGEGLRSRDLAIAYGYPYYGAPNRTLKKPVVLAGQSFACLGVVEIIAGGHLPSLGVHNVHLPRVKLRSGALSG